jgi:hypothetical protein
MDEDTETRLYHTALTQVTVNHEMAAAEALAQADALLHELARDGRYPDDGSAEGLKTDRLRLARALIVARRKGIEDGVALYAWWHDALHGEAPAGLG